MSVKTESETLTQDQEQVLEDLKDIFRELKIEGYEITGCSMCSETIIKEATICPLCNRVCYPDGQLPH